ncbi:hypothetical protein GC176_08920 [bacterium]|nr:hypothetical protein [bacterium]
MNWIPYYAICAFIWFAAWGIGFWYFRSRQQHGPLWKRLSWPRRLLLLLGLIAVPVTYAGSHTGYQWLLASFPDQRHWLSPLADLYVPLQFFTLLADGVVDRSFEPLLYPLTLLMAVLVPLLIHRMTLRLPVRRPGTIGILTIAVIAVACFIFMLSPT